jgi:hypothetical protein
MNEHPFDRLEQQLTQALARRAARPRPLRRLVIAVAAILVSGGAGTAATAGLRTGDPRETADRLMLAGERRALSTAPCEHAARGGSPGLVGGLVPTTVSAKFGVFRRPMVDQDKLTADLLRVFPAKAVLASSQRKVRAPDGTRFALYLSVRQETYRDPVACEEATAQQVERLAAKEPATVQRILDRRLRARRARVDALLSGLAANVTVIRLDDEGNVGSAGGSTLFPGKQARQMLALDLVKRDGRRALLVSGLVPDGVAAVRVRNVNGPPGRRARTVRSAVQDNVFAALVSRRMGPRAVVELLDDGGEVLKAVRVL